MPVHARFKLIAFIIEITKSKLARLDANSISSTINTDWVSFIGRLKYILPFPIARCRAAVDHI